MLVDIILANVDVTPTSEFIVIVTDTVPLLAVNTEGEDQLELLYKMADMYDEYIEESGGNTYDEYPPSEEFSAYLVKGEKVVHLYDAELVYNKPCSMFCEDLGRYIEV